MFKTLTISALALAAALTNAPANADDVHTLTPHYPDNFKIEMTRVSDSEQFSQGRHVITHSKVVIDEAVQKADPGYAAVLNVVSADASSHDDAGNPSPQQASLKSVLGALSAAGAIDITMDKDMTPISVDNIETIKPRLRQALTSSGDTKTDAMGVQLYDSFVANLTPVTAASFLKQMHQAGASTVYNRPLPLHIAVTLPGAPVQVMGATFHLTGTETLDSWDEGKSATVTTVLAPTDADMRDFVTTLAHNMLSRLMTGDNAKYGDLIDHLIQNMHINMTVTCHTTIDLSNYVAGRTECTTQSAMTMDLAKAMPPEVLKDKPQLASLPPITATQSEHSVTETRLVQ